MATEKIDEIFDIQAINNQTSTVIKKIESVTVALEKATEQIVTCNRQIASSQTFDELTKATNNFIKANEVYNNQSKEIAKLKQTEALLNQKLQQSYIDLAKKVEKIRQEVSEEAKAISESVKAQQEKEKIYKAAIPSITATVTQLKRQREAVAELTTESKRLQTLMDSMNYTAQEADLETVNAVLNANTALITLNTEAYLKQKINISHYQTAAEGLHTILKSLDSIMQRLAHSGGTNSEEFHKLYTEFEKIQIKSEQFTEKVTALAEYSASLKTELNGVNESMQQMALTGELGTEKYEELNAQASELTQTIQEVDEQINNIASPVTTFESIITGLHGLAGGFQAYQNVLEFCNIGSEEFQKIQSKVQAAIAITNGLIAVKTALDQKSALMISLNTAAQSTNIVVSKAATVAQLALNAAIKSFPLFLIISAIIAGVTALGSWLGAAEEASEEQKRLNDIHEKAVDGYAKEKVGIENLTEKIRSGNVTRSDQAEMVKILNELHGESFTKNKNLQEIEAQFLKDAPAYIEMLQNKAKAQAAFDLAIEKEKELLKEQNKSADEYVNSFRRLFTGADAAQKLGEARKQAALSAQQAEIDSYLKSYNNFQKNTAQIITTNDFKSKEIIKEEEEKEKKILEIQARQVKAGEKLMIMQWQQSAEGQKKIYENEKNTFKDRYAALENYKNQSIDIINEQKDFQLSTTQLTENEKKQIEANAQAAILELQKETDKEKEKLQNEETGKRIAKEKLNFASNTMELQKEQDQKLLLLSREYAKGKMSAEEYEKSKLDISKNYNQLMFDEEIQTFTAIANLLPEEERTKVLMDIKQKQIEFTKQCNAEEIVENEKRKEKQEEQEKLMKEMKVQLAQQTYDAIFSITNSLFERKIQKIDEEIEKVDEQKEHDLEVVEEMNISDEEKAERKKTIEKKAEIEKEKLEKKKKKEQLKQAKADKANAMIQIMIDTAAGMVHLWRDPGGMAAIPFMAILGTISALQLATIAAQPLPQYAKGIKNHPGGPAIVGDGGKKELIKTPQGDYFLTPDAPTFIELPKHSEVLPDFNLAMKNFSFHPLVKNEISAYNFLRLEQKIEKLEKSFIDAFIQNRPQMNINLDKEGVWSTYEKQKGRISYINERLNIRI